MDLFLASHSLCEMEFHAPRTLLLAVAFGHAIYVRPPIIFFPNTALFIP
jgi:hypothetical protein